jgi:hypothetical protein
LVLYGRICILDTPLASLSPPYIATKVLISNLLQCLANKPGFVCLPFLQLLVYFPLSRRHNSTHQTRRPSREGPTQKQARARRRKHGGPQSLWALVSARAGNRRFDALLSAPARPYRKAPYKPDPLWETLIPRNRPGRARTVADEEVLRHPAQQPLGLGVAVLACGRDQARALRDLADDRVE